MHFHRSVTASAAILALALGAGACGSSGSSAKSTSASSTTSIPTSAAPTDASTSTSTSGSGTSTAPATGAGGARCTADQLTGSSEATGAAAGSRYTTVVLTNTAATPCTLEGYPGVSLADAKGAQIGHPAKREANATMGQVMLAAKTGTASFLIHTTADVSGTGCLAASTTINVIPPNDTGTVHVPGEVTVCGDGFWATPVVAGTAGRN